MSPTIYKVGSYRFFFNSREESRMHVHVATPDGVAKFWLEPIIALATFHNLKAHELRKIEGIVEERQDDFRSAWHRHFAE